MSTEKWTNRSNRISYVKQADGSFDIVVPASMAEDFKLMVKKGTNLSPDMHVEIRDFTDRLFDRDQIVNGNMKWGISSENKSGLVIDKSIVEIVTEEAPFAIPSFVPKD